MNICLIYVYWMKMEAILRYRRIYIGGIDQVTTISERSPSGGPEGTLIP